MILDDVLFAIILAGIGLSGAYLHAELIAHRRVTAVERRRELVQRELHSARVARPYAPFAARTQPDRQRVGFLSMRSAKFPMRLETTGVAHAQE